MTELSIALMAAKSLTYLHLKISQRSLQRPQGFQSVVCVFLDQFHSKYSVPLVLLIVFLPADIETILEIHGFLCSLHTTTWEINGDSNRQLCLREPMSQLLYLEM